MQTLVLKNFQKCILAKLNFYHFFSSNFFSTLKCLNFQISVGFSETMQNLVLINSKMCILAKLKFFHFFLNEFFFYFEMLEPSNHCKI